jgi:hypothetical protein
MANDATKVSFGKPKSGGAVFVAPSGTTVPTDATSSLDAAFKNLGYISDDGMVNSVKTDTETVNAWGGDKVLVGQTTFGETFTVNLLETNADALAVYYGDDNVSVSGDNITITQTSEELDEVVLVLKRL